MTSTPKAGRRGRPTAAQAADVPVLPEEHAWTPEELAEVQAELETERERLRGEIDEVDADLASLMSDSGEGAGDDQADVGAATLEREQELSIANNARDMLVQIEHALDRISQGGYGVCENCGKPIGKGRLMAFPRATLCMACKQREERR